jgi:hypothetical protein
VVDKYLQIDEFESKWVLYMFNSVIDGVSVIDIKRELDRNGVETTRTKSGLWSVGTIQKILQNKSYTGIKTFYDKELDETFEYQIDSLISVDKFRRVRKEMNRRQKLQDNNKKHFTIFDDIDFRCECTKKIGSMKKEGVRKNGKEFKTHTYYCLSKQQNWRVSNSQKTECVNKKSMNMKMTDDIILDVVKDTVSNSHLLKEKFKNDVLSKKSDQDKDSKKELQRLDDKHGKIVRSIERTYENLVSLETDLIQERTEKKVVKGIIRNLQKELKQQKTSLLQVEQDIDDEINKKEWVDWLERHGEDIEFRTRDDESRKEFINGIVGKIVVKTDYEKDRQVGHTFDLYFKMKIVKDKLVYEDQSDKRKGYEIKDGRTKMRTGSVNLTKGRGRVKKKD